MSPSYISVLVLEAGVLHYGITDTYARTLGIAYSTIHLHLEVNGCTQCLVPSPKLLT